MIDPIIPKSLVDAIKDTFSIQASTTVEIKAVSVVPPGGINGVDVVSVIGLNSPTLEGTRALCFPKATFLGVMNKMLAENYTEITVENADGAGELLNITYGGARVKINEAGHSFMPAIPTVAIGDKIQIVHKNTQKIVRIECNCGFGPFFSQVSLRKK